MPAFIESGHLDRLAPGKGAAVTVENSTIALFKVGSVIYAIEPWCLRCGACLADGSLQGAIVACGDCGWRYDVSTGSVVGIAALRLRTFDVQVVGGKIILADA